MSQEKQKLPSAALFVHAIAVFWIGLIIGISFIATPVKFFAASLTLPVALEIGRHTFGFLNKLEWFVLAALLFPIALLYQRFAIIIAILIGAVLVAETFWLLPQLDKRVDLILAGQVVEPSILHASYVAAEVLKCVLLFTLAGFGALQQRA
ncbi:MAG: hypothetical protein KIT15_12375 [Xanthobacteraceae bacterium]|nr:hypothetical protein [Xanthobacteraceae bacterium]MCW5675364.1 hypothetical protein [Xanthobacteraceae bacterium]MCW5676593.1 hypothetical protein [Xanthobacteraceae bacterium]